MRLAEFTDASAAFVVGPGATFGCVAWYHIVPHCITLYHSVLLSGLCDVVLPLPRRPPGFAICGARAGIFLFERRPPGGAAAGARLRIASDGAVEHFYGRVWRSSRTHRPLLWSAVELHFVELHGMTLCHP